MALPFTPQVADIVTIKGRAQEGPYFVTAVEDNGDVWLARQLVTSGPWKADQLNLEKRS